MKTKHDHRTAWLKTGISRCMAPPGQTKQPYRLVLLGAPGVGKGTQAALFCEEFGACHLSTGDVFRAAGSLPEEERGPALNRALEYMRRGELVPDEIVLEVVSEQADCLRCPGGFLLDGFPRTIAQAKALDELLEQEHLSLTSVADYELSREKIIARLAGRRICPNCKATYHVTNHPPRVEGVCDNCGAKLQQREDDKPEAVRVRLQAYEKKTRPLIEYYKKRGLLIPINADGTPEQVYQRTIAALRQIQSCRAGDGVGRL